MSRWKIYEEIILKRESITVVDSKTEKDLTRAVLMQIISEQECKGYESILTKQGSRTAGSILRWWDAKHHDFSGAR